MASRIIISGLRSIEECLNQNPERISKLLLPRTKLSSRVQQIKDLATRNRVLIETNPESSANSEEGVLAVLKEYQYVDFSILVSELKNKLAANQRPVVMALDSVTDPQNLGAIIRTAAFMGIDAIILPKDRSAQINDTVYRVASGGLEHVEVSLVTNLVTALEELKQIGFWTIGFSEHSPTSIKEVKLDFAPVLVIGNEEKGIRPLVQKNCDYLVCLEPLGGLSSLNASVASALAMAWVTKILVNT